MAIKTTNWIAGFVLAGLLAFAGCGKSGKSTAQGIPATIDLAKFTQAFPSPAPKQQSHIAKVIHGVRYGLYPDALAALDKLASDSALTEPQKQAVNNMIGGIKQAIARSPAALSQ